MLSAPDIAILGAVALLVFGPDQLPKVARKFGTIMRDVQSTSQQFIREMERAADEHESPDRPHLEAVPSTYGQAASAESVTLESEEGESEEEARADEPMLPGIEPEPVMSAAAPRKKLVEPAEF